MENKISTPQAGKENVNIEPNEVLKELRDLVERELPIVDEVVYYFNNKTKDLEVGKVLKIDIDSEVYTIKVRPLSDESLDISARDVFKENDYHKINEKHMSQKGPLN